MRSELAVISRDVIRYRCAGFAKIASVTSGHNVTCFDYEVMISPLFRWPNSVCHYFCFRLGCTNLHITQSHVEYPFKGSAWVQTLSNRDMPTIVTTSVS
ncbi:hypothetical protein CEQ36_18860 [Yersinia intermedia]|nr:hypothetical protein A6J67_06110 [Yersinia sp. FDAARGOS_228]AVL37445.1 hypothetical protein CEQ36_18860 [Yersinia intermedia]